MVCFVMALKCKAVSQDWGRVSQLCEAAVQSAFRQTDPDIKILVACHEPPDFKERYDDRLEIIPVDLPRPTLVGRGLPNSSTMVDKWGKLHVALVRAGHLKPNFVMIMDADDLISNRIAAWAHAHTKSNGGVIRFGYRYHPGDRIIQTIDNYDCGTNAIINTRLVEFPADLSDRMRNSCLILQSGHQTIEVDLQKAGTPLDVIPFRAGIYIVGHGDNDSINYHNFGLKGIVKTLIKHPLRIRRCSRVIREEFAMDWLPANAV